MEELLAASVLATEFFIQSRSTAHVQAVVQLSLAPAFLLAGIGAIMNVMTTRLIWVANRIDRIEQLQREGIAGAAVDDLPALEKRRSYAQAAVMLSTAAALSISVVIALLFISAFIQPRIGTLIAVAWILTMVFLIGGLALFVMETRTAARRNYERVKERKRRERESAAV